MHKNEPSHHRAHITKPTMILRKRLSVSLCLLICTYMLAGCTLEDPSYAEYVDNNGEYLTCKNISAIMFEDATITRDNPIYQGRDYTPAFKFHMCPNAAPNCIADIAQTNRCTKKCAHLCYGECVADYRDIHIASCEHPDKKTITCADEYADCDGNLTNGCEYHLTPNHVFDCQWNASSKTAELLCQEGWADCDNNPVNGCEYELETHHALSCQNQQVTCLNDAVYSDCDGNYKNGCEYDMTGKNITSCQNHQFICKTGFGNCDGEDSNACETDLLSDNTHCGGCTTSTENHTCPSGQVCNGQGQCADTCAEGSISCGGACINIAESHISTCEDTLDAHNNIISTTLRCIANYANCDDDPQNGCEFELSKNNARSCEHHTFTCLDGFEDCNGDANDGCEFPLRSNYAEACTREEKEGIVTVTLECTQDYANCDGNYQNGCKYQLSTHNAIQCQHVVDDVSGEISVSLTCMPGWEDCDKDYTNGCEYNLYMNHALSCRYNNAYCATNDCDEEPHIKKRGLITCIPPYADVDHDYRTGCEVDGTSNADHCGAKGAADNNDPESENYKGKPCDGGQVCQNSTCGTTCDEQNGYKLCTDPKTGIEQCLNLELLHLKDCNNCIDTYCDINGSFLNGCEVDMILLRDTFAANVIKLTAMTAAMASNLLRDLELDEDDIMVPIKTDACFLCPGGWEPDPYTVCHKCPPGHYSKTTVLCKPCPAGMYANSTHRNCLSCNEGTYSAEASDKCTPCPAGTYAPTKNTSICTPCPANTYSDDPKGAKSCDLCSAGMFSNPGSSSCSPCPAGSVSVTGGGCYPCKAGFYPNDNHTECRICPENHFSVAGSAACTPCPDGQTNNDAHTACE